MVATVIVATMAGGMAGVRPALAQSARVTMTPGWNRFSADMTIQRSQVKADGGAPAKTGPTITYHWEQTLVGQRWSTVMTLGAAEKPQVRSKGGVRELEGTTPSLRIEDAGDGSPLKIYDHHGKPLQMPSAAVQQQLKDLAALGGAAPIDGGGATHTRPAPARPHGPSDVLIDSRDNGQRRAALASRFGRSQGKVGALDRYLSVRDGRTTEVLADAQAGLPVEVNVARDGVLMSHMTFEYAQAAPGQLVRSRIHSEQLVPNKGGARMVTDVSFNNIRFERGGR